jgi:hypothetical protein
MVTGNRGLQNNFLVESHRFHLYFHRLHKYHEKGGIYDCEQVYPKTPELERAFGNRF